jgi:dTDP-4-dehydrorhamnose 3,5-epimerase
VLYKVTNFYAPQSDLGILWNDPALHISWPAFAGAELSQKDLELPRLSTLDSPFLFAPP